MRAPLSASPYSERLTEKLQNKMDNLSRKFEKKAQKYGHKYGQRPHHAGGPHVGHGPAQGTVQQFDRPARKRQIFVLIAVMIGVGVGLSLLGGGRYQDQKAMALIFCLAAGTFGPLLTYFRFLLRSPTRSPMWDRLAYTGMTTICMVPAFGIAADPHVFGDDMVSMLIAPLAVLFCCDWTKRIVSGRLGEVELGQAFWPAVVGLIAASITGADNYVFTAAVICAVMSLLTQAGAAMWPFPQRTAHAGAGGAATAAGTEPRPQSWTGRIFHGRRANADAPEPAPPIAAARPDANPPHTPRSPFKRVLFGVLATLIVAAAWAHSSSWCWPRPTALTIARACSSGRWPAWRCYPLC